MPLSVGVPVEIASYLLSPELASGLEQAALAPPPNINSTQRLEWFELSSRENASLSPASAATIALWQKSGIQLGSHLVQGPAFWETIEIEDAPALIAASSAALAHKPA